MGVSDDIVEATRYTKFAQVGDAWVLIALWDHSKNPCLAMSEGRVFVAVYQRVSRYGEPEGPRVGVVTPQVCQLRSQPSREQLVAAFESIEAEIALDSVDVASLG